MSSITITYEVNPPSGIVAGGLGTSKKICVQVPTDPHEGQKKYYGSLHNAIRESKDELGKDLTTWRDAIGKAELIKETPRTLKYEAGEEEEEEEEGNGQ